MKILINSLFKNNEEKIIKQVKGLLNDNVIKYYEDLVKVEIDLNSFSLKRVNDDYELFLNFCTLKGYYYLKDIKQIIDLKITLEKLEVRSNSFIVIYKLDISDEVYNFELNYEVI